MNAHTPGKEPTGRNFALRFDYFSERHAVLETGTTVLQFRSCHFGNTLDETWRDLVFFESIQIIERYQIKKSLKDRVFPIEIFRLEITRQEIARILNDRFCKTMYCVTGINLLHGSPSRFSLPPLSQTYLPYFTLFYMNSR